MRGLNRLNPHPRVVITGLGLMTPSGIGREAFWEAVVQGRSGIDWISAFDASDLYCRIAGEVRNFDPTDYMNAKEARKAGRFAHFAVAAARLALADGKLDPADMDPYRVGVVFSTSTAGNGNMCSEVYRAFEHSGPSGVEMTAVTQMQTHAATAHIQIELGLKGPNATSGTGCVGSLDSLAIATNLLRTGQADAMLCGGAEANISPVGIGTLCRQRVLTAYNDPPQAACRPYDETRDGLVLSEGGGAVLLETLEHAEARGAAPYAEVIGSASTCEAYHLIAADPSGEELAMAFRRALAQGRVSADEVDYVCAHGIGNRQYDIAETNAIKMVLGARAYHVPVSSIKSSTGQPFAAGGAWQVAAACMTLRTGLIAPTINYHHPDPQCDLDYVPNRARRARVETVMLNSHSFGGTHGALVIRRVA